MELKPSHKITEIGTIPEDWEIRTLDELFNFSGGFPASRDQLSSKGYCYLHYGDIHGSKTYHIDLEKDIRKIPRLDVLLKNISSTSLLSDGDVVFVDASEDVQGASKYVAVRNPNEVAFIAGLHTIVAKAKTNEICKQYLEFCFLSEVVRTQFRYYAAGTKVIGISKNNISKILLSFPKSKEEQITIATALSDMNELIISLEKLIIKKKAIKYGTMQQLMSGKYRMEGFCGEWEVKLLGDLCEIYDGTHQTPNYTVTGFPFYSVENVTNNEFKNTKFISGIEHKKLTATYKIEKGDILMTRIGSIGVCKYIDWDVNASFYVSLALLKCNKCVNSKYLYYYSFTNEFQNELELNSLQSAIPKKINLEPISLIKVILPPTIEEQIAISTILSDMDSEIEALVKKLTKYRTIKQGMIQELLTGRIRLIEITQKIQSEKKEKTQNHNEHFNEAVVLSALVSLFSTEQYPVGRFKRQKLAYLLHRHIEGTTRGFLKKAAGPYNPSIKYKDEAIALKNKYVKKCKTDKAQGLVPSENIEQAIEYFKEWYGEDAITWLEQFHYTKNEELELLATVDMAIMDLKTKQQKITVDTVKSIICTNKEWKPKLERATFSDRNIQKAIKWSNELFGDC